MQFPGHSDHVLARPLIAELRWPVVADVQNNQDAIVRSLKDLILLKGQINISHLQLFEFAEGRWDMEVVEGQDEATMLEGVDDLGLENGPPAESVETDQSWCSGTTSNLVVMYLKLASWDDSIWEVGKVGRCFGGGA